MTTSDSAQVTPAGGVPARIASAERAGSASPAAELAARRAWLILWLAFATFCVLVFAATKFIAEYVSTAEVDQSARVTASRGVVFLALPGSAEQSVLGARSELGVGTALTLDRREVCSADLTLFDGSRVQLQSGSTLELTRMEVGRFINQQYLLLTQTSGVVRYASAASPLEIIVPNGTLQLAARGDYTVWLDGDLTRVLVYAGEARVAAGGPTVAVPEGKQSAIDAQRQIQAPHDRLTPLLTNADFAAREQNWEPLDVPNNPALDINGQRLWVEGPDDNSTALRLLRETVKNEHGETGLVQSLDRDVSGFRHLWLQAEVRVDHADLSGGGTVGSEYPMMLRLRYEGPVVDSRPDWQVGFYYSNEDKRPVPENLAVLWPRGEWKTFRVDLTDSEAARVPYRLLEFAVLAQGHSYDARVAGISLVGD